MLQKRNTNKKAAGPLEAGGFQQDNLCHESADRCLQIQLLHHTKITHTQFF